MTIFPARLAVMVAAALLVLAPLAAAPARSQSPNDMARFLAGLPPAAGSPLAAAVRAPGWRQHAAQMDAGWGAFERQFANRIRVWSAAKLPPSPRAMYYMFGGPDFPHAEAFFPDARVYVLSGLEPVGGAPGMRDVQSANLGASLASLRVSLGNYFEFGYFITKDMGTQLRAGDFTGTLPLLYVFLARSGKTIGNVEFVALTAKGDAAPAKAGKAARGVRISFAGRDGVPRALYYFRTDLSNGGVTKSGFLNFCARQGAGGALIKSASYLLHTGGFSKVRDFLLGRSAVIVQDDSGIPLKYFEPGKWRLRPFGQYIPPIEIFKRHVQPDMAQLFARGAERVNFGIGYRWHPERTTILVAERM